MSEWHPISTAPAMTPVLLYCPTENEWPILIGEKVFSWWSVHGNEIVGEMCGLDPKPTHWMHIPEPPK